MIKKIKTLLKDPKQVIINKFFLNDNTFTLDENIKCDNTFVLSHLGQLKQVDTMIKFENLKNNLIIIVYTEANLEMPNLILEQYDREIIDNAVLFKLPRLVNNLSIFKIFHLERIYKKLLETIDIQNSIYLMSFEGHYGIFAHLAKEKNIRLDLVEEGTATYKLQKVDSKIINTSPVVNILPKTKFLLSVFPFLYDTKRLIFLSFDTIYAGFLGPLESVFDVKNVVKYFAHSNIDTSKVEILVSSYGITKDDYIYVNQRYPINEKEFSSIILDILYAFVKDTKAKVFIKMHPKDTPSLIKAFQNTIMRNNVDKKIVLVTDKSFLIEPVISLVKPKVVLGLTSTSLVYTSLVSPKTKVVSIAPLFLDGVRKNIANTNGVQVIENHFSIMKNFQNIEVIEKKEDIQNIPFNETVRNDFKTNSKQMKKYLNIAQEAYTQAKYLKASMYYEWACDMDVDNLSLDDKINYLLAIENIDNDQKLFVAINSLVTSLEVLNKKIKDKVSDSCINLMNSMFISGHFDKSMELENIYYHLNDIEKVSTENIHILDNKFIEYFLKKLFLIGNNYEFLIYYDLVNANIKNDFIIPYKYLKKENTNFKLNKNNIIELHIYFEILYKKNNIEEILNHIHYNNKNIITKRFAALLKYEKYNYRSLL